MAWTQALRRPCAGREHDWQLPRIAIDLALRFGLVPAEARLPAITFHYRKTFHLRHFEFIGLRAVNRASAGDKPEAESLVFSYL